jgi:hypothetical protein
MVGVPVRREQVAYARRRGLSQRRSCTLLTVARSALGYRSIKATKDAPVVAPMAALSAQYPRYGYRRRIFLGRDGLRHYPLCEQPLRPRLGSKEPNDGGLSAEFLTVHCELWGYARWRLREAGSR